MVLAGGRVVNCLVTSNRVQRTANGGGVDWTSSYGCGGGIYMSGGSAVNCTMAGNLAVTSNPSGAAGSGIYQAGGAVTNTIAYFNSAGTADDNHAVMGGSVVYSCAPELSTGLGNLTGDPQFVNRSSLNYRLGGASICLDAGTNMADVTADFDGNPRPQDGDMNGVAVTDMGCYEFVPGQTFICNFTTTNPVIGVNGLSNEVFTAVVSGPAGQTNIVYYWWDFGAGTAPQEGATLRTVTNHFGPGLYTISLIVSNTLGEVTNCAKVALIQVTSDHAYVAPAGGNVFPYDTWGKAATGPVPAMSALIQAVNYGASSGQMWVAAGTYTLGAQLNLAYPIQVRSVDGATNTILARDSFYHRLLYLNHPLALVDGFTVTNGYLQDSPSYGAGIYVGTGTVFNCVVAGCQAMAPGADARGGGIYMNSGLASNVLLRGNTAQGGHFNHGYGGGLYMADGTAMFVRAEGNTARGSMTGWGGYAFGGGIFVAGGQAVNCLLTSNRVDRRPNGGGTDWTSTFGNGGGMYVGGGSVLHCTAADNFAVTNNPTGLTGAGIYQAGGGVTNAIAAFNTAVGAADNYAAMGGSVTYSCASELGAGAGNLIGDPQFVNRAGLDYRLRGTSICLDAGSNVTAMADLDGNPRPLDGDIDSVAVADMGCYEFVPGQTFVCNFTTTNPLAGVYYLSNETFTAVVSGPAGHTNIGYYWWDFGAGTTPQEGAGLRVATNHFGLGIYTVSLTVSNTLGEITNCVKVALLQVTTDHTFVSPAGGNVFPYDTWAKAAPGPAPAMGALIQAINFGAPSGQMWVAAGTYTVDAQLNLGYPIQVRSVAGARNTVFNRGAFYNRFFYLNHPLALVDGFTVTNGYLQSDPSYGAGIYLGTGTVLNCVVASCRALAPGSDARGGGLFMISGLASNVVVRGNTAQGGHFNHGYGGGLYMAAGTAMNVRAEGNTARGSMTGYGGYAFGGGLFVAGGQVMNAFLSSNRVERRPDGGGVNWNVTYGDGGGIYMSGGSVVNATVVDNLSITSNPSGTTGGGLYQAGGMAANCVIFYNASNAAAPAPDNYAGAGAVYSGAPELTGGVENVVGPPLFGSAAGARDYTRFLSGSPCLNVGTNQAWMLTATDLGGHPRLISRVDMGAYESPVVGTLFIVH